eukprot:scaffold230175_cov14-Tisochrysis_lutea.AAC.1
MEGWPGCQAAGRSDHCPDSSGVREVGGKFVYDPHLRVGKRAVLEAWPLLLYGKRSASTPGTRNW